MDGEYLPSTCGSAAISDIRSSGTVDQLKEHKSRLESRLAKVNAALDALEKNPEVAEILQLVSKAMN